VQRLAAEVAEHDTLLVDDHTQITRDVKVAEPLIQTARGCVAMGDRADARLTRELSLTGQSRGEPVRFASVVTVDLGVPERFEPPRGSAAQVSINALAIDDDWTTFVRADSRFGGPCGQIT